VEVRDNPGVLRIPVSDPREAKEGLLKFALPRTCLAGDCESSGPEFYPKDEVVPGSPATPPAAAQEPSDSVAKVDAVLNDLGNARQVLNSVSTQVDYAGFNIKRTRQDLFRMDYPLANAERDTGDVDSSGEGQQLDFKLWGARNSLSDTERSGREAAMGGEKLHERLDLASQKLRSLRAELAKGASAELLSLADQATMQLGSATGSSGLVAEYLVAGTGFVDNAGSQLRGADAYVSDIKYDMVGSDVSGAAKSLRKVVDQAGWKLNDAGEQIRMASPEVRLTEERITQAEDALFQLRERLAGDV